MKPTLNGGESHLRFATTYTELETAGLCRHCLEAPPVPRPTWYTLTEDEIDEALEPLETNYCPRR